MEKSTAGHSKEQTDWMNLTDTMLSGKKKLIQKMTYLVIPFI